MGPVNLERVADLSHALATASNPSPFRWKMTSTPRQASWQPEQMRRLGILIGLPEGHPEGERWVQALLDGLAQLGWVQDKNIKIDLRWGSNNPDRMQILAKELIDLRPDLIEVTNTPATAAILRQTRTIPVVFSIVSDPLGSGFVESFVRPGGNATGFASVEASLPGKWLALLREIAPTTTTAYILFNPKTAPQADCYLKLLAVAADSTAVSLDVLPVTTAGQMEEAIGGLSGRSNCGLVVIPDIFTGAQAQRDLIISLTARHRIPAIYFAALFMRAGGLISYGVDHPDLQRRAATYVHRVLKGTNPRDLPVQFPTKFELAINLKTAQALGLTVPPNLRALAHEFIE